jgi:hypothetical protein
MYDLPSDEVAGTVVVGIDTVRDRSKPTVLPRGDERSDRAAS